MPLIEDSAEPFGGRLLLWQFTDREVFAPEVVQAAQPLLTGVSHPARRTQRLAVCALLQRLGPKAITSLWYDEHGKPWIRDPEGHISISHASGHAGLYYHPGFHAGIDLEVIHPRIGRVAPRFLHPIKEAWALNDEQALLKVWSAKEAAFKAIGGGGIHFKEELHVEPPQPDGSGRIHYQGAAGKKTFRAIYRDLEGAQLVYTIAE